jgi:hypothetical protein
LVDVNGIELAGRTVAEISEIIRSCPDQVVCTVKLSTDFRVVDTHAAPRADYAEIDLSSLRPREDSASSGSEESLANNRHPRAESVDEKPEITENTHRAPHDNNRQKPSEKSKFEDPEYDEVIPSNLRNRHSLPLRQPPGETTGPGKTVGDDMQYLELDFPVYDRPRLKSDPPKKPNDKKPAAPIAAYAYIELDFKDKPQEGEEFRNLNLNEVNEEK